VRSIVRLTEAADFLGKDIKTDYKPSGAYEIRKAGIAFLKMTERINKQFLKRTRMLAMISHDLRTPLTRMKLQLELMPNSEEKEGFKSDINSMIQIISSYLDFAKGEYVEETENIQIYSMILNAVKTNYSNFDVLVTTGSGFNKSDTFPIKKLSFMRALSNLMDNAVKYSDRVRILLYSDLENLYIDLEDNGIGIKDSEKIAVFQPFFRSDKARNLSDSGNVGLGLAITHEIIKNHRGSIVLKDSKDLGGLCVHISIPIHLNSNT
jgi:two-component system osmolarity sensor histidine kinase EnvZ